MANTSIILAVNKLQQFNLTDADIRFAIGLALSEGYAHIMERIFNQNKDINGIGFGSYSEKYKEYRKSLGLQVQKKDLQLSDRLKDSISIDMDRYAITIGENSDINTPSRNPRFRSGNITQTQKAKYNEENLGQEIFSADEFEKKAIFEVLKEELENIINSKL